MKIRTLIFQAVKISKLMFTDYSKYWDEYYKNLVVVGKKALWDVDASLAAKLDLSIISKLLNNTLPLLDLGCGTGTQSKFLAQHFDFVIGIDVSQTAIELAEKNCQYSNLNYYWVDDLKPKVFEDLHKKLGDTNIYMRGVIHQIKPEDLRLFNNNLKTILGQKGKLYFIEVADNIRDYFSNSSDSFSRLPDAMKQTFLSNLPPRGLSRINLDTFFDFKLFKVIYEEECFLNTNLRFLNNEPIRIPAYRGVIKALS